MSATVRQNASWPLRVLAVLRDEPTVQLMSRTIDQTRAGDVLTLATDLAEGLARAVAEAPDLVFVDVGLGKAAGLATVHHLCTVVPGTTVYALASPEALELGTQALSLGGAGLLVLPLSGDELLTCLADVRTRRAERMQLEQLSREADRTRAGTTLLARVNEIIEARTRREAADRLAEALVAASAATQVIVYLAAAEGARQLMRSAVRGEVAESPAFCDELELFDFAQQNALEVVRLASGREHGGLLLLGGMDQQADDEQPVPLIDLVAAQAATALALIGEREQSHRGAMKDPDSSAYTFAYFVDVAGREIDKARRHRRRFALVTLGIEHPGTVDAKLQGHTTVQIVEQVLGAVRDTDVLARVDDHEFLMLLPETGGIGAHACRRRVLRQLGVFGRGGRPGEETPRIAIGVATFPHDGTDLSQLLRVAKHRAHVSCHPAVRKLCQEDVPLAEILDLVTWQLADAADDAARAAETLRVLEVSQTELVSLGTTVLTDALRGGGARVVTSQRPGLSLGAAVRSMLGREQPTVQLDLVDVGSVAGCADLEVLSVIAEHGAYALLGRVEAGAVSAVHTADPLFSDVLIERLGDAAGVRLID